MTENLARNHYDRLQVSQNATLADLTKAFRKLAKRYHPDVASKSDSNPVAAFHLIRESYEILSNPLKRQQYDQSLSILSGIKNSSLFPNKCDPKRASTQRNHTSNSSAQILKHHPDLDLEAVILIDLKKVFSGGLQRVNLNKASLGGYPVRSQLVNVEIPKHCVEGERIHVPMQGRYNISRGLVGHLNLKVEYAADIDFKVRGFHMYTSVQIYPWDAAIGVSFPLRTPAGPVTLQIPSGTHQWQTFRMQGCGLPKPGGHKGDLFVYIKIKSIEAKSADQLYLWKALKASYLKQSGS